MSKRVVSVAVAASVCLFLVSPASAQDLDARQKEVWKAVGALSAAWKAGKIDEYYKHVHDDFTGWYPDEPFPNTKGQDKVFAKHLVATKNVKFIFTHPMRIVVKGNVAITQYYTAQMATLKKGQKDQYRHIQWTDTWLKEDGRWKILATHGTWFKK